MKIGSEENEDDFSLDDEFSDFDFDEFDKEFEKDEEESLLKKNKKKEYYVKKADLIDEIQKYQDSKRNSPNGKRKSFRRTAE